MRNLTIKRKKSFVACLYKIKVYIEDLTSDEIFINNIPCRKIGEIKNGEEKTFQISEQPAKVFVIADKLSKDFCNEFYELPYGQEDVVLSGANKFNLATGNAFRFDNNDNEAVIANRKKGTRKGVVVLIIAAIIGFVFGFVRSSGMFSDKEAEIKAFSVDGMSITLTDEFSKEDYDGYNAVYESMDVAVMVMKEEFTLLEGFEDYTLEDYFDLLCEANEFESLEMKTADGLSYFEYDYEDPESDDRYCYTAYLYKSDDAFWMVEFATLSETAAEYSQQIAEWAKSVEFDEQQPAL